MSNVEGGNSIILNIKKSVSADTKARSTLAFGDLYRKLI
jgi:hypothetical protein